MKWMKGFLAAAGTAALCLAPAAAADYPNHTVTLVVPYGPGGATDIVARMLADNFQKKFNQSFVVLNKPGALGLNAMQEVLQQKTTGYTIMIGNVSTNAITPVLFASKMTFDYDKTFTPVTQLAEVPGVLVTTTVNFSPRDVKELIAYGKANPGKMNYATTGIGTYPHFDTEIFLQRMGIDAVHVPVKGGASDMITSMVTGETQFGFINAASAEPMIKAGRLRPIAVVSPTRLKKLPDVPTMAEVGFGDIGTMQWQAMYVRSDTPPEITETLFKAAQEAMRSDKTTAAFETAEIAVKLSASPREAQAWQQGEMKKWREIVARTKTSLD